MPSLLVILVEPVKLHQKEGCILAGTDLRLAHMLDGRLDEDVWVKPVDQLSNRKLRIAELIIIDAVFDRVHCEAHPRFNHLQDHVLLLCERYLAEIFQKLAREGQLLQHALSMADHHLTRFLSFHSLVQ